MLPVRAIVVDLVVALAKAHGLGVVQTVGVGLDGSDALESAAEAVADVAAVLRVLADGDALGRLAVVVAAEHGQLALVGRVAAAGSAALQAGLREAVRWLMDERKTPEHWQGEKRTKEKKKEKQKKHKTNTHEQQTPMNGVDRELDTPTSCPRQRALHGSHTFSL